MSRPDKSQTRPAQQSIDIFVHAARINDFAPVADFVKKYPAFIDAEDHGGRTALMYAARFGHLSMVDFLLAKGASADHAGHGGFTPLILAAAAGYKEVTQLLVKNGADADRHSRYLKTAFQLASRNGHRDVIVILKAAQSRQSPPKP